jgi:hypothetical protein
MGTWRNGGGGLPAQQFQGHGLFLFARKGENFGDVICGGWMVLDSGWPLGGKNMGEEGEGSSELLDGIVDFAWRRRKR